MGDREQDRIVNELDHHTFEQRSHLASTPDAVTDNRDQKQTTLPSPSRIPDPKVYYGEKCKSWLLLHFT